MTSAVPAAATSTADSRVVARAAGPERLPYLLHCAITQSERGSGVHDQRGAGGDGGPKGRAARRRAGGPARRWGRRGVRSPLGVACRVVAVITSVMIIAGSSVAWLAYHWLSGGLTTSNALDAVRRHAPARLDNAVNLLLI